MLPVCSSLYHVRDPNCKTKKRKKIKKVWTFPSTWVTDVSNIVSLKSHKSRSSPMSEKSWTKMFTCGWRIMPACAYSAASPTAHSRHRAVDVYERPSATRRTDGCIRVGRRRSDISAHLIRYSQCKYSCGMRLQGPAGVQRCKIYWISHCWSG